MSFRKLLGLLAVSQLTDAFSLKGDKFAQRSTLTNNFAQSRQVLNDHAMSQIKTALQTVLAQSEAKKDQGTTGDS